MDSLPPASGKNSPYWASRQRVLLPGDSSAQKQQESIAMTYSYSQISQYLTCPRRYRHRYLDGWQEKDLRAAMLFGRAFEQALAALFRHEDPTAVSVRAVERLQEAGTGLCRP